MVRLLLLIVVLLAPSLSWGQATCTQTISLPTSLALTISAAAPGSVICLNSGNWGTQLIGDIQKAAPGVIIRSATGLGAVFTGGSQFYRSSNLTYDRIAFAGLEINDFGNTPRSNNVTVSNSTFSSAFFVNVAGNVISNTFTVGPGNIFANYSSSGGIEGHLYLTLNGPAGAATVTVTGNTFDGTGTCSDGIQNGINNVTITMNLFVNKQQGSCGAHVDGIQLLGGSTNIVVEKNFFINDCVHLGFYDGSSNITVRNNVFAAGGLNCGGSNTQAVQIGCTNTTLIEHNTFFNSALAVAGKESGSPGGCANGSQNVTQRNNLYLTGVSFTFTQSPPGGDRCAASAGCTLVSNQFQTAGLVYTGPPGPTATNNLIGAPTFLNGTPGTSCTTYANCSVIWAQYQLANGSIGKNAALDGQDMGTNYYGGALVPDTTPPSVPTGVTVSKVWMGRGR